MAKLETVVVGVYQVNCYLYWNDATGDGVIIDPGDEEQRIAAAIERLGFTPKAILLTHGHIDHIAAVEPLREQLELPVYIGSGEEAVLADPTANVSAIIGHPVVAPKADHLLSDEQVVSVGSLRFRVLATPGHSPGGICYLDEAAGWLFCGDTLFWGSIGRTDLKGSSYEQLIRSIQTKIMKLPDSVICYPGHGPQTTVGGERVNNPFLAGGAFA